MTEVAFHFGAPDKLAYASRLLRKATSTGARLWVLAEPAQQRSLSDALWSLTPTSFLPHCSFDSGASVVRRSAVLLADHVPTTAAAPSAAPVGPGVPPAARDVEQCGAQGAATDGASYGEFTVLVNLRDTMPEGFEQFQRLIEVVSLAEDDRQLARARWKRYTALGYTITRHDLALRPQG